MSEVESTIEVKSAFLEDSKGRKYNHAPIKGGNRRGMASIPAPFKSTTENLVSFNMNKACTLEQFKSVCVDTRIEYVDNLRKKFNVPDIMIAEMMGISRSKATKLFRDNGVPTRKRGGRHMSEKEIKQWNRFVGGEETSARTKTSDKKVFVSPVSDNKTIMDTIHEMTVPKVNTNINIELDGNVDVCSLISCLSSYNGKRAVIKINISLKE